MRYRVEDKIHLWGYLDFKSSINAKSLIIKQKIILHTLD